METKRYLIDYLPPFMQEFHEMKSIMEAGQPEFDSLYGSCENALNDQFIMYATENGVKRYEKIMSITPKDTDTLDERKFRILTKMNQELPYTEKKLQEALTNLCGPGNFKINIQYNVYHIEVKLALTNAMNYQDVVKMLAKMVPANMTQHVQIMYNSNNILSTFTHEELSAYTHHRLRNEVFE